MMPTLDPVQSFYAERIARYGNTLEALGWSAEGQQRRFDLLTSGWDFSAPRQVLDVGCGRGDLLLFLMERYHGLRYHGLDCMPEFVTAANRRFGFPWCDVADVLTDPLPDCDYAVASGVFNLDVTSHVQMRTILERMASVARKGIAFDCLSMDHPSVVNGQAYYTPLHIFALASQLMPNATMRFIHHDPLGNIVVQLTRQEGYHAPAVPEAV